jgi:hypothetical protein
LGVVAPPPSPDPSRPSPATTSVPIWGIVAATASLALAAFFLGRATLFEPHLPSMSTSAIQVTPTPNVIVAVRDLARLETADYHIERVIELADAQSRFFGLLQAKDALLLVAVGDVVAGIDLAKISDSDVKVDWPKRAVRIHLPAAEVFSVALDNARTHVVSRETDTFASRQEALEGRARSEAEGSMRTAATEGGVLDRAKSSGERAVRDLLRALGFETITFD